MDESYDKNTALVVLPPVGGGRLRDASLRAWLATSELSFDPRPRGDYGYGTIQNVVTSLDFERLLCATGPHEGEILRPSDHRHPHNIAWIHCVGSRQVLEGGHRRVQPTQECQGVVLPGVVA